MVLLLKDYPVNKESSSNLPEAREMYNIEKIDILLNLNVDFCHINLYLE